MTSGELAKTVHQSPGVPVAVPGSATGSRSPKRRWYIDRTSFDPTSALGISRSRGMAGNVYQVAVDDPEMPGKWVDRVQSAPGPGGHDPVLVAAKRRRYSVGLT